ncbi:MAG: DUF2854 domain-containing protein [Synechococcaceae cyanobacterium]|nr:DUF2854 domain-containing protein [Synechococcaceae cyanobacterium]
MHAFLSPGSLVTIAGALLTVVGAFAYLGDNANLSLPTIFYGIPILLGGLALKSSELPPVKRLTAPAELEALRSQPQSETLRKLLKDVLRWRYGQKAHLESSLEALKLWDETDPPQLTAVEELECGGGYGLRLFFDTHAVPFARWSERQERLGRFFGPDLSAELESRPPGRLVLSLLPSSPVAAPSQP